MEKVFKQKKGITLIALVITIIVLLILAGISISMLSGDNGILRKAVDAKTWTENSQITERIQLAYHSALTGGQGSYTKESLEAELKNEFGENNYNVDDSDNDNWVLSAKENGKEQSVTIPAGQKKEEETFKTYKVGDEVTINGEHFYVIYDSNETESTVRVLSKECIDTVNLVQLIGENNWNNGLTAFSTSNYWVDSNDNLLSKYGNAYPADLTIDSNLTEEDGQVKKALYISQQYGKKFGAEESRLLTYEEARELENCGLCIVSNNTNVSWDDYNYDGKELHYWLGSAADNENVYKYDGTYCDIYGVGNRAEEAVRPVCIFLKSKISE